VSENRHAQRRSSSPCCARPSRSGHCGGSCGDAPSHSYCVPQITARNRLYPPDCGGINESTRPMMGLEAEGTMRLASFENLLAVATLVSAIVVVLWGIRLFHGA
jgi:hypothetical protein